MPAASMPDGRPLPAPWPRTISAARAVWGSTSISSAQEVALLAATSTASWYGSLIVANFSAWVVPLNYGRATVRCIWPLADGWCFHTLMTGRFGAPANQALATGSMRSGSLIHCAASDWSRYNRSTLDPQVRVLWESAIAAFFATRSATGNCHRGTAARHQCHCRVRHRPMCWPIAHLAARAFWRTDAGPTPAGTLRPHQCRPGSACAKANSARRTRRGPARRRARAGFFVGVGRLDHHQDPGRSGRRGHQGREPHAALPLTHRCAGQRLARGELRRQALVCAPEQFQAQPRARHEEAREPRGHRPADWWADRGRREFLARHDGQIGSGLCRSCSALNPAIIMVSGSVYRSERTARAGVGSGRHGRGAVRPHLPDRLARSGSCHSGRRALWRCHRALRRWRLPPQRRCSIGGETGRGCHIDASMYEICVQQMHEAIVRTQSARPRSVAWAISEPGMFHQDSIASAGERSVDRDQLPGSRTTGSGCWRMPALPPGLELAAGMRAWTPGAHHRTARRCMSSCRPPGFCGGLVQDIEDLLEHDPQIASAAIAHGADTSAARHLRAYAHAYLPSRDSTASPFRAPALGEHSREIARELSGSRAERVGRSRQLGRLPMSTRRTTQPQGSALHRGGHGLSAQYVTTLRSRVIETGEPFVVAQADTPHEIFHAMDIALITNQWWSAYISAKQLSQRYFKVLEQRGYPSNSCRYCSLGLACTLANDPRTAPWGGLPRPVALVARLTCDCIQQVFGQWADGARH